MDQPFEVAERLRSARVVAVLGAHVEPYRAAFYVPDYLFHHGYRILPVNPQFAGQTLWNETVVSTLKEITEAVDIVDVFRRPEALSEHLADFLAMRPPPKLVWLQLGIRHAAVKEALIAAGIDVVEDRCALADHRALVASRG
ncbi:MAG: CoA-binding protein [Myxococcales bacterium]|nr:CoA-binding protein [Myxococcales bacterium]